MEVIIEFNKEIENKIKKDLDKDNYYGIWKNLQMLKEIKERGNLCTGKC